MVFVEGESERQTLTDQGLPPALAQARDEDHLKDRSFFMEINEIIWRIRIQVLAMQMDEYLQPNGDKPLWKSKMLEQLKRVNEIAQTFNPQSLPSDLRPASLARIAEQGNWLDTLTQQLTEVFLSAPTADISRIEL